MTNPNDLLAATRELVKCAEDYEWTERCYNLDAARVASDRTRLIAAIAAWQAAAGVGGWRPIESAPRDDTDILVYRPNCKPSAYIPQVGTDRWHNNCWWHSNDYHPPKMRYYVAPSTEHRAGLGRNGRNPHMGRVGAP